MNLPLSTWPERLWHHAFRLICWAILIFLIVPILVIVPLSFNSSSFLSYPLSGLSMRWYTEFFSSNEWMLALKNSFIVAPLATLLATAAGTLAAVGLARGEFRGKGLIMGILISPMVVPVVIVAVGLYFFYAEHGLLNTYTGLVLAHAVLGVPFVVITVTATLQGYNTNLSRAAASLGAPPLTAFFRVTMPLIAPGLISGGLFAFATSFDEVIVVLFIGGPGQRTLPREIFDGIREHVTPAITAVATLLILFATALMATMEALRRRNERLAGQRKEP